MAILACTSQSTVPTVITQPATGAHIGVGMYVYLTVDGPTASDDLITVAVSTGTASVTDGRVVAHGGTIFGVQLGWDDQQQAFSSAPASGAALGTACTVQVFVQHHSGVLVSFTEFTGYFHDPVSGWLGLLSHLVSAPAHDPMLDQILANTEGGTFKSPLIGVAESVPYGGNPVNGGTLYDLTPPAAVSVLGLTWNATTTPGYVGGELGVVTETNRRVIQVIVFHTLLGGTSFADQTFDSHGVTGTCWFDSPNPTAISVFAWPGFQLDLSWLVIL